MASVQNKYLMRFLELQGGHGVTGKGVKCAENIKAF